MNILITSASRKVWLIEAFRDALKSEKIRGRVVSVDSDPLSAALYKSHSHYLVPGISDKAFMPRLLKICNREKIALIIPTSDKELLTFAKKRGVFRSRNIEVIVSLPEVVTTCADKYRFYHFLKTHNIQTPDTMLRKEIKFSRIKYPVLIKSRYGSGGKEVYRADNERMLKSFLDYVDSPLIQQYIKGIEYTVDLFSDLSGRVISVVPRQRIQVFSGESYKGKTVKEIQLIKSSKYTAERLGSIGHITLQFIKDKKGLNLIEINPRFGGGAALSIKAGCNTPLWLVKMLSGKRIRPKIGYFKEGLTMLRYTKDIFLYKDKVFK